MWCANHDDQNLTTGLCAHGITRASIHVFEVHVRCVEGALGLGGHVLIGVVRLVARFYHADAIPSVKFFPSGFCCPIVHL